MWIEYFIKIKSIIDKICIFGIYFQIFVLSHCPEKYEQVLTYLKVLDIFRINGKRKFLIFYDFNICMDFFILNQKHVLVCIWKCRPPYITIKIIKKFESYDKNGSSFNLKWILEVDRLSLFRILWLIVKWIICFWSHYISNLFLHL